MLTLLVFFGHALQPLTAPFAESQALAATRAAAVCKPHCTTKLQLSRTSSPDRDHSTRHIRTPHASEVAKAYIGVVEVAKVAGLFESTAASPHKFCRQLLPPMQLHKTTTLQTNAAVGSTSKCPLMRRVACGKYVKTQQVQCAAACSPAESSLAAAVPCQDRVSRAAQRKRVIVCAEVGNGNGSSRQYDYDLITIGAGSGGVRASRFAASYGAKAACVELPFDYISSDTKGGVGGTCVLRGCVPKKLMVYASEYADDFRDSVGFGWEERPLPRHTWSKFLEAKRKELQRLNGAYKNTLKNANVELMEGFGRIVDPHTVDVNGKKYTTKHILVAVGGKATKLSIPGADLCITSDEALELPSRPNKITILGGGYIALEFGGIFQRFGSDVHSVFRQQLPLRGFDEEVRKFAFEQYQAAGLNMHPGYSPVEVKKQENGLLTCVVEDKQGSRLEITDNDYVGVPCANLAFAGMAQRFGRGYLVANNTEAG
eukprot:GHRR01011290.1.p2 GENE.GHRR01011290.1~~GHRR01011290.1.p2  ORF type:complete len:486 (+),score=152.98 GHRR01011290.1:177-1634(+)